MSYQVLARKWRPKTFSDVVGQEHVLTALTNGLSMGRIHHAYLFSGTRGVGKTTIARLLAKGLNCEDGITAKPCGQCINCSEITQGRFVDLIEIDAASRTKVEDTRELLDNTQYTPARGRFKVYLIDEVHMLSRHSFNALLKTLEEPPEHVKFLLATTHPQKLPVTVLSRCLQFHLKVLDVEQIYNQLQRVLVAEQVTSDAYALQLLARAADGSMRDALNLTDQAISFCQGQVITSTVTHMLNASDDEQSLAILEALERADGEKIMERVAHLATQGISWESFLVTTLALLHRLAMLQLLPQIVDNQYAHLEERLRKLARTFPPSDIQLYYQTLLIGRKELTYAPDHRMGVEMTLLRALAFHPKMLIDEQKSALIQITPERESLQSQNVSLPSGQEIAIKHHQQTHLSHSTTRLLNVRSQPQEQGVPTAKNSEPAVLGKTQTSSLFPDLSTTVLACIQKHQTKKNILGKSVKPDDFFLQASNIPEVAPEMPMTSKELRGILEHEQNRELSSNLLEESFKCDTWSMEISKLELPKLVHQFALNSFKQQQSADRICLHLRSRQCHLDSPSTKKTLAKALSELYGRPIELSVVIDDNSLERTPMEWRQAIYEEKLARARESIIADTHIQTLCCLFDAELDENSIRLI